jgi:GcrA cell cycle regulator
MWQAGKSASEIAEKLGGVTRNAVIGKAHRLGLSGRPSPIKKIVKKTTSALPPKKAVPSAPLPKASSAQKTSVPTKQMAPAPKIMPKLPANAPGKPAEIVPLAALANMTSRKDGKLVSILELTEKICRWPVGDPKEPGFGYCGAEAYPNHPYCAEHVAIAFQAPNRKDGKKIAKPVKADEAPELEDLEVEVEEEDIDEEAADVTLESEDDDDTPVVTTTVGV